MGAEPFFFKQAKEKNAPATYARVMKFFVITLCCMFLASGVLYLDVWKQFIFNESCYVGWLKSCTNFIISQYVFRYLL
jgi:hypothetical protein